MYNNIVIAAIGAAGGTDSISYTASPDMKPGLWFYSILCLQNGERFEDFTDTS